MILQAVAEPTRADRAWDIIYRVSILIGSALCGVVIAHESRISAIEASRFTDRDASILEREMKEWTANNYPPPEVVQALKDIKESLKIIDARLREIEMKR